MILSDYSIRQRLNNGSIKICPTLEPEQLQPASIDLRLGNQFVVFTHDTDIILDVRDKKDTDPTALLTLPNDEALLIAPGEFLLATTLEQVTMPDNLVARVEGRSSIGRLGLTVHVTAGFIDPGFDGQITLEIANLNRYPIQIYVGMRICQLAFESMTTASERPYGSKGTNSKYQGQRGVTPSRITKETT